MNLKARLCGVAAGILLSLAALSQTVTTAPQTITVTIPAQTIQVVVPSQTAAVVAPVSVPTVPATKTPFVVYDNGVFNWPGDWSYSLAAPINYKDTVGAPAGETYDISVTTVAWGAWQPYATNNNFDRTGYTKLVFSIKPTIGTQFSVQFLKVGDAAITDTSGNTVSIDPSKYCKIVVNAWATCAVPLDAMLVDKGVILQAFYKFAIQSHQGGNDLYYIANVSLQ